MSYVKKLAYILPDIMFDQFSMDFSGSGNDLLNKLNKDIMKYNIDYEFVEPIVTVNVKSIEKEITCDFPEGFFNKYRNKNVCVFKRIIFLELYVYIYLFLKRLIDDGNFDAVKAFDDFLNISGFADEFESKHSEFKKQSGETIK